MTKINIDAITKEIEKFATQAQEKITKLENTLDGLNLKKMELISVSIKNIPQRHYEAYGHFLGNYRVYVYFGLESGLEYYERDSIQVNKRHIETLKNAKERVLANKAEILKDLSEQHEKNKGAIENNKKVIESVKLLLGGLGITESWSTYEYPTKRSQSRKEIKHYAGYLSDLSRCIPTNDEYEKCVRDVESRSKEVIDYADKYIGLLERFIDQKERASKEEEMKVEKQKAILKLSLKYNSPSDDVETIYETMKMKHKLIPLAVSMEACRGDFSAYKPVQRNAEALNPENDFEKSVQKEILELVTEYDGDGRVFRDCEYNYNVLWERIRADLNDEEFLKDFGFIKEKYLEE